MCGEHNFTGGTLSGCLGSSPHVRGAPAKVDGHVVHVGIIPACAGSTDKQNA